MPFVKERTTGMWKSPKTTFIDMECKLKAFVPPPNKYVLNSSLMIDTKNARKGDALSKEKRQTLPI
jgi:hypothetical protein